MLTVSQLAQRCGLSRGALLYYESVGLLKPAARTAGNYRNYGEADLRRLQQICVYREAGSGNAVLARGIRALRSGRTPGVPVVS
jgi:DNA-binding transcriptional MerR regulator